MALLLEQCSFMSTGELTDTSQPRYILAQKAAKVMELELKTMTKVHFLTDLMQCIPYELQEYFNLVPPQLAGAWSQYTLSMGGAGAGASFHMHEAAINVVVYGTRKWYVPTSGGTQCLPRSSSRRVDRPHTSRPRSKQYVTRSFGVCAFARVTHRKVCLPTNARLLHEHANVPLGS